MEAVTGLVVCRVLEFMFINIDIEILLMKNRPQQHPGRQQTSSRSVNTTKQVKAKQDALLVIKANASYADLLKTVKEMVNPSKIGVEIHDVRKTRSGELLLTLRNGSGKLEDLKEMIQAKVPEVSTSLLSNKRIIHVKEMDEITTIEDIREAIDKSITAKPKDIEMRAQRPTRISKQNAIVVLHEPTAVILMSLGKIRIGCWKECWKHEHKKAQCKGPDQNVFQTMQVYSK
ncbi:hypothetical protein JTB14_027063 [Gonioctena quinquepunctata]|nr:hypothetical protein JTB14_027063 [Gonioctena quinquepunctata]